MATESDKSGPLAGLVVVDASWGMPAAVATMLFSDYGAKVIKVERPSQEKAEFSVTRAALDRGKWSVTADLETDAGRSTLTSLLRVADVFVESFGPKRAKELGLRHEDLSPALPRLIQCSLSAYGQQGPWSDRPGYDCLVAARLGLMAEQAGHREGPTFLGHPSVSYGAGFLATIGTLAALHDRRRSGRGQQLDVSLLDSVLAQSPMNWWWNEKDISYLARSGTQQGFGNTRLVTDLFECADGEYLMMHTGGDGDFKKAADLLGFGESIKEVRDQREILVPLDEDERHVARVLIPEKFKSMPRQHWLGLFAQNDIAIQPVLKPGEVLDDPQVCHAGIVMELPHPRLGPLTMPGPTITFRQSPPGTPLPAPTVGEHMEAVRCFLAERQSLGPASAGGPGSAGRPASAEEPGPAGREPLEGIRVLDFSSFFATSYGAKILSDLGADVIKVEAPSGDPQRGLVDPFEAANRGKRGVVIDMKSPDGRQVAARLIDSADVVMHNMRPGKAEKIGLGYEELAARNPRLIYCYLPGFGSTGPRAGQKSFAPLISGLTGLLYQGAGEGNRPVRRVMGNEDYNNGFVGAIAVLMALHHRDVAGAGQYVENPQLHSNLLATTEQCLDREKRSVADLRLDRDQLGFSSLYRMYRTTDGHICLAVVGERAFRRLAEALPEADLRRAEFSSSETRKTHDDELADRLGDCFSRMTAGEAFTRLDGAEVPCEIVAPDPGMPDFLWDEWAFETARVFEQHHPEYGWIREIGFYLHLSGSPVRPKTRAPLLGEHSEEVLKALM